MKGVILAGGKGTRLAPLTTTVNKHLLPVGGKSMIHHCVDKLTDAGITEIMVVTGGEHLGGIAEFLGSGTRFGCQFTYRVQEEAGGIAQALGLAEGFVRGDEPMCVILGDNIFQDSLKGHVGYFNLGFRITHSMAMVLLKEVPDPQRYGVAQINKNDNPDFDVLASIEEKPKEPKSNLAVTGIYFYTAEVFPVIQNLKPSGRGELEITDVNNYYIRKYQICFRILNGWWTDAGTHESYQLANLLAWGKAMDCP